LETVLLLLVHWHWQGRCQCFVIHLVQGALPQLQPEFTQFSTSPHLPQEPAGQPPPSTQPPGTTAPEKTWAKVMHDTRQLECAVHVKGASDPRDHGHGPGMPVIDTLGAQALAAHRKRHVLQCATHRTGTVAHRGGPSLGNSTAAQHHCHCTGPSWALQGWGRARHRGRQGHHRPHKDNPASVVGTGRYAVLHGPTRAQGLDLVPQYHAQCGRGWGRLADA
jgi:hypothetical protein